MTLILSLRHARCCYNPTVPRPIHLLALIFLLSVTHSAFADGVAFTIQLPPGQQAVSATATARTMKLSTEAVASAQTLTFKNLLPDTPYDVSITLTDGTILQGVDLSWYDEESPKPDASELNPDDREQIRATVQDIKDFYNRKDILLLSGSHERATVLVQLIRDTDFHAGNGNVIWRAELWYFKNEFGGWQKIAQQNQVLRRERYKSAQEFHDAVSKLKWTPQLGGIRIAAGSTAKTITLSAQPAPSSQPAKETSP